MMSQAVRRCLTLLALIPSLVLAVAGAAQAQSQVYVLEPGSGSFNCTARPCYGPTVDLVNTATGHDLGSIQAAPPGQNGNSVRLSSDGARLFVTSNSFVGTNVAGQLSIVDAMARVVLAQVTVGVGAADVAILPDNSRAYVVNTADNSVSVVDLSIFTVVATVAVQSAPARVVAATNGSAVYVTNSGSGTVSKISTINNRIEATIVVGTAPRGLDISPDGTRLFVANSGSNSVSVIDTSLDSVQRNLAAGGGTVSPVDVIAQSGTAVYVALGDSGGTGDAVQLLNAAFGAVITVLGNTPTPKARALARDSSGTPAFLIDSSGLERVAADAGSVTPLASSSLWVGAAVVTDPCAFEATATRTVFGLSGGSGTLTIPAPSGCAWTMDPSGVSGLSIGPPLSGTGPATRSFTVASTSAPRLGALTLGRQAMTFEQTVPRMNVEFAPGTGVQQEPFTIGGWAFEENAFSDGTTAGDPGVDVVHVWAYPASGAAPMFVGVANYGLSRQDVGALFGTKYSATGFQIAVGNLPSGTYTFVVYAHSHRSNTFSNARAIAATVQQAPARIAIDTPGPGVSTPFVVSGWAVDPAGASGTNPGVDVVHVWAYPASGGTPRFLGQANYGITRPDVAAFVGPQFARSGFTLNATLTPGTYTLAVYARSVATGQFFARTMTITVAASNPLMAVDTPAASSPAPVPPGGVDPGTRLTRPFAIGGWTLDLASGSGSGVDAVHVWAYPVSGAAPVFVGVAAPSSRPDVGNAFGAQYAGAGFSLLSSTLPPGTYDLVVFAHSTVTLTFNNAKVVRITVQ